MNDADLLIKYFPTLNTTQIEAFGNYATVFKDWNEKINLISRKDVEHLYERHILHSLAIAKYITFEKGTRILDAGTGGGFPGLPLAILFPDCEFVLVDSIGKKINAVADIASQLGVKNALAITKRFETLPTGFDFVVSRAVAKLPEFLNLTLKLISPHSFNALPNGVLYLKGGELSEEIAGVKQKVQVFDLSFHFTENFFETKKLVFVQAR